MRARVLAPLLAAVLGIAGGVTTALVAQPGPSAPRQDPLDLDIALVDLDCTGEAITVLGYGAGRAALSPAVANAGDDVRYLRTDASCPTVYGPSSDPRPPYVVYTGPYAAPAEPCATRMEGADDRGSVTVLRAGNEDFVKCACVLPQDAGPELRPGMQLDPRAVTWIRLLQVMMHDDDPEAFPRPITGRYDERTVARVAQYQAGSPGKLTEPGVVDPRTWKILTDRMCPNYDW